MRRTHRHTSAAPLPEILRSVPSLASATKITSGIAPGNLVGCTSSSSRACSSANDSGQSAALNRDKSSRSVCCASLTCGVLISPCATTNAFLHSGLGCAAMASRNTARLFLSVSGRDAVFCGIQYRGVADRVGHALPERCPRGHRPGRGIRLRFDYGVRFAWVGLKFVDYSGLGCAAWASLKAARFVLSTMAVPVSTHAGNGDAGALRQSLNSCTAL